jgi:formylmethanofuran dehydrogenase subunit C
MELAPNASYSNSTTVNISTELSGSGSFTNSTNSTLNIGATSTSFSISTFDASANGNTVNFNRSGDQDMRVPSSSTFYHLTVSNGSKKSLASADITVNGNLTVSASTELDCNNYQITGNASGTLSVASGGQLSLGLTTDTRDILFPSNYTGGNISLADGSKVLYRAKNDQTLSCVPSYYNLSMQDGTGSSNRNLSGGTTLTVRNDLDLENSSLTLVLATNTLDVNGDFSGAGALSMTSGTFYLGGDFTNYGTFTYGTGMVVYDGAANQTMRYTTYYNLNVNKTGGKIIITTGSGTLTINNDFNILNGTVELEDKTLTVSGTVNISDTLKFINTIVYTHSVNNYVVASSGVHDNANNARITFNGNLTVNGVFNSGTQNQFFAGTSKSIAGTASFTIYDATVSGSYTNQASALTIYNLSGSGSFTNGTNKYLYISGSNIVTTFDATASGNTVNYSGSSSQTIRAADYYHLRSSSTGARTILSSTTVRIAGDFYPSTNSYTVSGGTIEFNGSGAQTIPQFNYYNLTSSSSGARTLTSSIVIGIAGTFTPGSNSYTVTGNTVSFNGSGAQSVSAFLFYNLTITNNNSVAHGGDIIVSNNFDIQGIFTASPSYGMTLYGNWNNDGIYANNGSAVTFTGSSDQILMGSTTFNNLVINKSAGKLTLNSAVTVNGTLVLTSGKIYTSATNLLTLGSSAAVGGASNSSYVEGPVAKIMASTSVFTFPTGKNGRYLGPGITPESSTSVTFRAEYFDTTTNSGPVGSGINHVSTIEYFQIDQTSGTTNAYVTLAWGSHSGVDGSAMADLRVSKWNGSQWIDMGQSSISGTASSGAIKSNLVSSFSPFKLASISSSNPLPVNLISFEAETESDGVELNWATASEINNAYFQIEKSIDAINFEAIDKVEGYGNSNVVMEYSYTDHNAINGISYYRLKQIDFNGEYEYSQILAVNFEKNTDEGIIILTDNISPENMHFVVYGKAGQTAAFVVSDLSGKICYSQSNLISHESETLTINFNSPLCSGLYLLTMNTGNGKTYSQKMLIP